MANSRASWVSGLALFALILLPLLISADPPGGGSTPQLSASTDRLSFELNLGQADWGVGFLARGSDYRIFVRPGGAVFEMSDGAAVEMVFANADPAVEIEPFDALAGKVHYLVGNDPDRWLTGIPTFGGVVYRELYPGIDLSLTGERQRLEFEFTIAAGADPEQVLIDLDGADDIQLSASGELVLRFGETVWRLEPPSFVQEREDLSGPLPANIILLEGSRVGFELDGFDPETSARIQAFLVRSNPGDPASNSSWDDLDGALRVAVGADGSTYVAGQVAVAAPEQRQVSPRGRSRGGGRVAPGGTAPATASERWRPK